MVRWRKTEEIICRSSLKQENEKELDNSDALSCEIYAVSQEEEVREQ